MLEKEKYTKNLSVERPNFFSLFYNHNLLTEIENGPTLLL